MKKKTIIWKIDETSETEQTKGETDHSHLLIVWMIDATEISNLFKTGETDETAEKKVTFGWLMR